MHLPDGHPLFIAAFGIRTLWTSKDAPHFTVSFQFPKVSEKKVIIMIHGGLLQNIFPLEPSLLPCNKSEKFQKFSQFGFANF